VAGQLHGDRPGDAGPLQAADRRTPEIVEPHARQAHLFRDLPPEPVEGAREGAANVKKMRARLWGGSRRTAAWIVNVDAEPELLDLATDNL
jgi:hypothetical protein